MSIFYALNSENLTSRQTGKWRHWQARLSSLSQKNPFYGLYLNKQELRQLQQIPTDPWPGSISNGKSICEGKFTLGCEFATLQQLWFPPHLSHAALSELHSFEWLRHLRALSDNVARRVARQLILHWIEHNYSWHLPSWDPEILGCRIANWISLYDFFCASANEDFRKSFYKSLWRQVRHLKKTWAKADSSPKRLLAIYGLLLASICLDFDQDKRDQYFEIFLKELRQQLLEDGGHSSRSPLIQLQILRILIDMRTILRTVDMDIPRDIQMAITKMAPVVRLFRHSDGALACFGPYLKTSSSLIDMVLSLADVRGRPPAQAPYMGFERCASKKGVLLINIQPVAGGFTSLTSQIDQGTGIFNFEWSIAKQRIITNADVVIRGENNGYIYATPNAQNSVVTQQEQHQEGSLFNGEFSQETANLHFHHVRSLYLSNNHFDFRGADTLTSNVGRLFAIRFMLHPEVKIINQGQTKKVYFECPGGQRWQFQASNTTQIGIEMTEDSNAAPMMVLLGALDQNKPLKVSWAFTAVDGA